MLSSWRLCALSKWMCEWFLWVLPEGWSHLGRMANCYILWIEEWNDWLNQNVVPKFIKNYFLYFILCLIVVVVQVLHKPSGLEFESTLVPVYVGSRLYNSSVTSVEIKTNDSLTDHVWCVKKQIYLINCRHSAHRRKSLYCPWSV